mmetsp:Transcript_41096/g.107932  ORF Transcript_41096/g.107932 Transcript_41096/m.107932 type:complete len:219 (-) Transcript_41096:1201-1857(-)
MLTTAAHTTLSGTRRRPACCTPCVITGSRLTWRRMMWWLCGGGPRPTWTPPPTPSAPRALTELLLASLRCKMSKAATSSWLTAPPSAWVCRMRSPCWGAGATRRPRPRSVRRCATATRTVGWLGWIARTTSASCTPPALPGTRTGAGTRGAMWRATISWTPRLRTRTRGPATSTPLPARWGRRWWGPQRGCMRWTPRWWWSRQTLFRTMLIWFSRGRQ